MAKRASKRSRGTGSLTRNTPGGCWIARWYDWRGRRVKRSTLTTDRAAAVRIMAGWIEADALRSSGLVDARAEAMRDESSKPIGRHIEAFEATMAARGRTSKHVLATRQLLDIAVSACGWASIADIDADDLVRWLNTLGRMSERSRQCRVVAVKSFTRWLVRSGKLPSDPLATVSCPSVREKRRPRRMLTPDEWKALDAYTRNAGEHHGMDGPSRALLYALALATGLRAGELRSIRRCDLRLDGSSPSVTLDASRTKNRRAASLPISAGLARRLMDHVRLIHPAGAVFALPHAGDLARMLRADAAGARAAWISEATEPADRVNRAGSSFLADVNEAGERLDFHSLRVSTASWLAMSGASLTLAQRMLRHSTPILTANVYTRHAPETQAEAVGMLDAIIDTAEIEARKVANGEENPRAHSGASHGSEHYETVRSGTGLVLSVSDASATHSESADRGISRESRAESSAVSTNAAADATPIWVRPG